MKEIIQEILTALGVESVADMDINESYTIERAGFNDLTIEKIADDRLSVAHTYTQRMDLMRDPEVVFDVSQSEWVPVEYQQDPMEYKHDESGLGDVAVFCNETWGPNLKRQGFVEAANEASA